MTFRMNLRLHAPGKRLPIKEITALPPSTIFLDVDGTLVPDGTMDLDDEARQFIARARETHRIVLASNSVKRARTDSLGALLGLPILSHKKPTDAAAAEAATFAPPYAVVGDKWWADGVFAEKIGARFFRTKPLCGPGDAPVMTAQYLFGLLTFWLLPAVSLFIRPKRSSGAQ